ncbi:probable Glutamyl-tRNA(Gln) amidotransferase subunit B, mitochondrial [Cephalotrichum gorgonifer]|uniref:Glutamyl-tRNA(Gln) amidotransferase subunit B, mitochondrial n=1 Tax=Cephalotrichum gorgonifer TaxID=2041049 RepID=A0AAE8MS01_9PEZI|nr:probable Glutamyl-tRNA(Gln) amidotransferase subunit B, mitochondrial [Cephalotrichum gorgonifer]
MTLTSVARLSRYLLDGHISRRGCLALQRPWYTTTPQLQTTRLIHTTAEDSPPTAGAPSRPIPLRKKLKDEAKRLKREGGGKKKKAKTDNQTVDGWELTVGIEIHAQLNTGRKLFSRAASSFADEPNARVAPFDLSVPGSQPLFQAETLVPALRAALAFGCKIQSVSRFDRKHYFWWDQPSGYQITQYYEPFARDGSVTLLARDGIAREDGEEVRVRIKQVQLEQDTGKTMAQPGGEQWVDFNRVGMPLVEIITEPDMKHPRTAAVFVKKVQAVLNSVDACVSGMEVGGLRADVNVSVRRTDDPCAPLGTRTEIKNLNTIKAVEDAIIAERDRQIAELEAGGTIKGETRGWTIGSSETRRLRGKEGEVDYRYMPDPDVPPLIISPDLVETLRRSVAAPPDTEVDALVGRFGLTAKDALSLMALEDGGRVEYFYNVVDRLGELLGESADLKSYSALAGNWILHELGKLTSEKAGSEELGAGMLHISPDGRCDEVPVEDLAELLSLLHARRITGKVAKQLLMSLYDGALEGHGGVEAVIDQHGLWFSEMSQEEYAELADRVLEGQEQVLAEFRRAGGKYPQGKLMFLVGKMMREGAAERINPENAEAVLRAKIAERCGLDEE